MIWSADDRKGVYESGFYRIRRVIRGFEVWATHPKNFRLVGKCEQLGEAKRLAEQDAAGAG